MPRFWEGRSIRFWIMVGMVVTMTPVMLSAVGGFILQKKVVLGSLKDSTHLYSERIMPIEHIRDRLWDTVVPIDRWLVDGDPSHMETYKSLSADIGDSFTYLQNNMEADSALAANIARAEEDWRQAAVLIEGIDTDRSAMLSSPELAPRMKATHEALHNATEHLSAARQIIDERLEKAHFSAITASERSALIASLAFISILLSILLISSYLAKSLTGLIDGARKVAQGDRRHRIERKGPPEFRMIADEFNLMFAQIQKSEEALTELALRDSMTHLLNRRAYDQKLGRFIAKTQRLDEEGALIFIDIDHFKWVNDTHGHTMGDEVLGAITQIIASQLREYDNFFRIGGEEFAILVENTPFDKACELAERLRAAVAHHPILLKDGTIIHVTISLGVAKATGSSTGASLSEAADKSLYHAKEHGRNQVSVIDETGMHDLAKKRYEGHPVDYDEWIADAS